MSKDFNIDDGKIAVNTSLDLSDYGRFTAVGTHSFYFYLKAKTMGLKEFLVKLTIALAFLDS